MCVYEKLNQLFSTARTGFEEQEREKEKVRERERERQRRYGYSCGQITYTHMCAIV